MTEDLSSLAELLQRARANCSRATATLFRTFNPFLLQVARRCLSRRLWSKEGPEDVVQQVWLEFFRNVPAPEQIKDAEHLQRWLATVVRRRAADVNRPYLRRPTHNVLRERSFADPSAQQDQRMRLQGIGRLWGEDLDDLKVLQGHALQLSEAERAYALLLWYGASVRLIAVYAGVSDRTVRRVLCGLARKGGIYETPLTACV